MFDRWSRAASCALAATLMLAVLPGAEVVASSPSLPPRGTERLAAPGFVLPVPGPALVLTPFRPPATRYGSGHRGVDLAAAAATPVRAAGSGVVAFVGMVAGRGVVSIDHPSGLRTTYEPVVTAVRAGQRVDTGSVLGTLSSGHVSCAPATCLHWGARLPEGSYLDPMGLLTGLRVRLLPWHS